MTIGFIDSTTLHSVVAALTTNGAGRWDRETLLECTLVLLDPAMAMQSVPGPGKYDLNSSAIGNALARLPVHPGHSNDPQRIDLELNKWLDSNADTLRNQWMSLQADAHYAEWSHTQRELFWESHIAAHGPLFNLQYIPIMCTLIGGTAAEYRRLHELSSNIAQVRKWNKHPDSDTTQMVRKAWLLSALIRGRRAEVLAAANGAHLMPHRSKQLRATHNEIQDLHQPTHTERYFARILVGAALQHKTSALRVEQWATNVYNGRAFLSARPFPEGDDMEGAAELAAKAAQQAKIALDSKGARAAIDLTMGLVAEVVYFALTGWGIGSSVLGMAVVGASRVFATRQSRFRRLGDCLPGRLERSPGP